MKTVEKEQKQRPRVAIAPRPAKDLEPPTQEEASRAAESQLSYYRGRVWELMGTLAVGIPKTHANPTVNNCQRMARLLALLSWYEAKITQVEMLHTPLWCKACDESYPGNPYLLWYCEDHDQESLDRSGRNWFRSLFAEVAK